MDTLSAFEQRKRDHIHLSLKSENQARESQAFDTIHLVHEAIPNFNASSIDIKTIRLGREVEKPFWVASMTAGHKDALKINAHLMEACQEMNWAMGVGSQRRELHDPSAKKEWSLLRKKYANISLFGNLGIAQLIDAPIASILRLIDAIEADALMIHCNPLQEMIQVEGTPTYEGAWAALERLVSHLSTPIIVKETGCGFSLKTLQRLTTINIAAVDISGLGGTHWGRIEGDRAGVGSMQKEVSKTFKDWGISTVDSVAFAVSLSPTFEIWGSGGVRHGLDAAKLFALGATNVGFAKAMLEPALISTEKVIERMQIIEYELKTAMFCTGNQTLRNIECIKIKPPGMSF